MVDSHIFWWIVALILFIMELITPVTIFIFPAIMSVFIALFSYYFDNIIVQGVLFFIGSVFFLIIIRPLMGKKSKKDLKIGSDALFGLELRVVETIDNDQDKGKVKHAGDIFPARSVQGNVIYLHQTVKVCFIEGITLFVEESKPALKL